MKIRKRKKIRTEQEIESDINIGIDYSNSIRIWRGIRELIELKLFKLKQKLGVRK